MLAREPKARPSLQKVLKEVLRLPVFSESRARFGKTQFDALENRGKGASNEADEIFAGQEERSQPFLEENYKGETLHGKRHGKGIYSFDNGMFDGDWKEDKIDGIGTSYYSNGNKYTGEWRNNKINGRGKVESKE
eukprot:TRINITY_DN11679_c0_g6_i1.p1 TRINITY_DN11679_c0_g6~~TRINITY_DN11679_c0_g6_i1.p1  ORF type:complete len:135 (+),score=37.04 TRINITY_DN11679_c0_g6_i1:294-698(+)